MLKIAFYNRKVAKSQRIKFLHSVSPPLRFNKKFSKESTVEECDTSA
jgi:hypothetical protein